MKRKIVQIIVISIVIILTTNCKKEQQEEINILKTNTGFCSQMKLANKISIPNCDAPDWLSHRYHVTNEYIYYIHHVADGFENPGQVTTHGDSLIIMDFEGNHNSRCIKDNNELAINLDRMFVTKNENIYISSWLDLIKLDKFGNEISRSDYHFNDEFKWFSDFKINEDNNTILITNYNDTLMKSLSLSSHNLVNSFHFVYDTMNTGSRKKTDFNNNIYIESNNVINIYNENGIFIRTVTDIPRWDTWDNGYFLIGYQNDKTIFRDINGNELGALYHYLNIFNFDYSIQVSPDNSTIVMRNKDEFYIYKVSE